MDRQQTSFALRLNSLAASVLLISCSSSADAVPHVQQTPLVVAAAATRLAAPTIATLPTTVPPTASTAPPTTIAVTMTPTIAPTEVPRVLPTVAPAATSSVTAPLAPTAAAIFDIPRSTIPPAPAPSLVQAISRMKHTALLYTTSGRFLMLVDPDAQQSVWLTMPRAHLNCDAFNDGATQYGSWSTNGRHIILECDAADGEYYTTAVLDTQTGKTLRTVAQGKTPEEREVDEEYGEWSPTASRFLLHSGVVDLKISHLSIADAATGAVKAISKPSTISYGTWSPDGRHIAVIGKEHTADPWQLYVLNSDGSQPQPFRVTSTMTDSIDFSGPDWSGDGRYLYYSRFLPATEAKTWRVTVATGEQKQIAPYPTEWLWAPDKKHYLRRVIALHGEPLSPWSLVTAGGDVLQTLPESYTQIAWMPNSRELLVVRAAPGSDDMLVRRTLAGREQVIVLYPKILLTDFEVVGAGIQKPTISSDGRFFVVVLPDRGYVILDDAGHEHATLARVSDAGVYGWRP